MIPIKLPYKLLIPCMYFTSGFSDEVWVYTTQGWCARHKISNEYATVVPRKFRTTVSFHPVLGLSLPMYI